MMTKRLLFLVLTALMLRGVASADSNFERWQRLPTPQLMAMGSQYAEQRGMPDSALVCFTIVTGRQQKNLTPEEKQFIVGAYNGKWFVYFFSFFDYAKSYESLTRAEELCDWTALPMSMPTWRA